MNYLLSVENLKKLGLIHSNTDTKLLAVAIKRSQDMHIQPALGTPLYNAANPSNQAGLATAGSLRGRVSPGLDLYVSRSIGNAGGTTSTGDFSMVTINPQAWTWYESPRFTLRTAIQSDGTVDLLYYGYAAIAPKIPFGAAWNQN